MVKKGILLILGLLVLLAVIVGCVFMKYGRFGSDGLTLSLREEDMRGRLSKKFPKTEKLLEVIPVLIEEPELEFTEGSNRVRLWPPVSTFPFPNNTGSPPFSAEVFATKPPTKPSV